MAIVQPAFRVLSNLDPDSEFGQALVGGLIPKVIDWYNSNYGDPLDQSIPD